MQSLAPTQKVRKREVLQTPKIADGRTQRRGRQGPFEEPRFSKVAMTMTGMVCGGQQRQKLWSCRAGFPR